jgi:outer membrane lipoprotein-sorting protein
MNILRRLSLSRLLLACAAVLALGVSITALAFALGSGAKPPPKPLAAAVHDALAGADGAPVQGFSADVTLTDHLLEGANLAGDAQGGALTSSPLVTGASGRLWIAHDGRLRLELQSEQGDTQVLYDGSTLSLYDAATNTLYRYAPPQKQSRPAPGTATGDHREVPSVAKIEQAISRLGQHADISGATPTNVGGQPAYTVRVSPKQTGSLIGGAELSFDAAHGTPLRAAAYSSTSSSPAVELAASSVSYGPVADSVFAFTPPANAKVQEVKLADEQAAHTSHDSADRPKVTTHGSGLSAIAVVQSAAHAGESNSTPLQGLPQVKINGVNASELGTELGTVLSFERSGVRYLVGGFVAPATVEAYARSL